MSKKTIDVRGLACPEPLLAFTCAAEDAETKSIAISFDCGAARDNITRAALASGWSVDSVTDAPDYTTMVLSRTATA